MKTKLALASTALLAACTTPTYYQPSSPSQSYTPAPRTSNSSATGYRPTPSMSVDSYKRLLAKQITAANPDKVYPGNPQAMLRSVVVMKYVVDSNGRLVHSDTLRSNGDSVTVATAMSALRKAAPFPPPPANLLDHGRMEILETALFNDDGRFQLRSVALPQSD